MIPTIVYDENILESFMAAAIVASETRVKVVERKSLMKAIGDFWFWCNVIPTKDNFQQSTPEVIKSKRHVVIANPDKNTPLGNVIPGALFVHGTEDSKGQTAPVKYGSMNVLERSMAFFNINQTKHIGVIDMVRNFYKKEATVEELAMCVLNAKEALHCLKAGEPYKFIIENPEAVETALAEMAEMQSMVREILDGRCLSQEVSSVDMASNVKKPMKLLTFFENKHWWYIQRSLKLQGIHYRNFTCGLTGNVVISDTNYVEDYKNLSPVVVH